MAGTLSVTKKIGKVNYEVQTTGREKEKRILHINMLREWHAPPAISCWAEATGDTEEDGDDPLSYCTSEKEEDPSCRELLSSAQKQDLQNLWDKFHNTLRSKPGLTAVTEHRINTNQAKPIRLPPYRIPYAYRDKVLEELKQMEADGIIERSSSEWAAPIVLVQKKDSSLRMCRLSSPERRIGDGCVPNATDR